jgi:8-oxo-dGTP pyrophosphatase MutT (NUDIX family)
VNEPAITPLIPAATVVVLRDGPDGIEALMGLRNQRLRFAAGLWVFPGGRIDPEDWPVEHSPVDDLDVGAGYDTPGLVEAGRRAAVREVAEETGLAIEPSSLVVLSLWTPPPEYPRRFGTVFFAGPSPDPEPDLRPDGHEILELAWITPADLLARRAAGEVEMLPPTYITMDALLAYATVAEALADIGARVPERYGTRLSEVEGGLVARYADDVAYDRAEQLEQPGPRHRLWMLDRGWSYERDTPSDPQS